MTPYETAKAALKVLPPDDIRKLIQELEHESGMALCPRAEQDGVDDPRDYVVEITKEVRDLTKIRVVKTLRELVYVSLGDAVSVATSTPGKVAKFPWSRRPDMQRLVDRLRTAGAEVVVRREVP